MRNIETLKILEKRETELSEWLTVVERDFVPPGKEKVETYFSVRPYDYVIILAVTNDHRIPLVKQYRHPLEKNCLDLPAGLMDLNKSPEETALIELKEETGVVATSANLLGVLNPDPGRLDNRCFCFFASNAVVDTSISIEDGIELVWTNWNQLFQMIRDGQFTCGLAIAVIAMASLKGFIGELKK
jgi:ADP-ribose pyrophosphatase